jgi:hypothetical protein
VFRLKKISSGQKKRSAFDTFMAWCTVLCDFPVCCITYLFLFIKKICKALFSVCRGIENILRCIISWDSLSEGIFEWWKQCVQRLKIWIHVLSAKIGKDVLYGVKRLCKALLYDCGKIQNGLERAMLWNFHPSGGGGGPLDGGGICTIISKHAFINS